MERGAGGTEEGGDYKIGLVLTVWLADKRFGKRAGKFEVVGEQMRKQIANIITSSRILCSICLLLCPVVSIAFYSMYLFCGITDMVDGTIARKTKSVNETGARLDTVADIVFVAVCFVKILPLIQFPTWLWIWIVVIATIKIGNVVWGLICNKKLVSMHTILNKVTGFLLFLFPLTLSFVEPMYSNFQFVWNRKSC